MPPKKPKPGRPPKKKSDRRDCDLRIPVTSKEKATIVAAVKRSASDATLASWVRDVLLKAAKRDSNHHND